MSRIATRLIAATVLAGFTLVAAADVNACCHHRRRCGGGCGGSGNGGGCGGGYCYSGYGYGGYYTAMPAPLFPRLALLVRNRNVAAAVPSPARQPTTIVGAGVARVQPPAAIQNLTVTNAGTANAMNHDGGGNE